MKFIRDIIAEKKRQAKVCGDASLESAPSLDDLEIKEFGIDPVPAEDETHASADTEEASADFSAGFGSGLTTADATGEQGNAPNDSENLRVATPKDDDETSSVDSFYLMDDENEVREIENRRRKLLDAMATVKVEEEDEAAHIPDEFNNQLPGKMVREDARDAEQAVNGTTKETSSNDVSDGASGAAEPGIDLVSEREPITRGADINDPAADETSTGSAHPVTEPLSALPSTELPATVKPEKNAPYQQADAAAEIEADEDQGSATDQDTPLHTVDAPVNIPRPTAGRAKATSGRVKTRLLGFSGPGTAGASPFAQKTETPAPGHSNFPVGWLIVVDGPGRGAAFTLFNGVTQIGRGADQTVRLDFGDNSISRENHAAIAYDPELRTFYLGHGGKANLVRLNNRPVLSTEELETSDQIRIGETILRFVALCGKEFCWEEKDQDDVKHTAVG